MQGNTKDTTPVRFAILHHIIAAGEHWDLLLESERDLLAWQLARDPSRPGALPAPARRLGNHRKLYLDYEGPVSGDRGRVRRIESGTMWFEENTPQRCVFRLAGSRLAGLFELVRQSGEDWILGESRPTSE